MKVRVLICGVILLLGMTAWAQEFPRAELEVDYAFARFSPNAAYTQGHSLNGGGGSVTLNINEYLGFQMDLRDTKPQQTVSRSPRVYRFLEARAAKCPVTYSRICLVRKLRYVRTDSTRSVIFYSVRHTRMCTRMHSSRFVSRSPARAVSVHRRQTMRSPWRLAEAPIFQWAMLLPSGQQRLTTC